MASEVKAPVFPESIEEGTVMSWLKQPGEAVAVDEKLAEIETDKVVLEVAATTAGVLDRILKGEGDTVQSGEVIAMLGSGSGSATAKPAPAPAAPEPVAPPSPSEPAPAPVAPAPAEAAPPAPTEAPAATPPGIGPSARKLIQEHQLRAEEIAGTGRQGRISKEDVLTHLALRAPGMETLEVSAPEAAPAPAPTPAVAPPPPTAPAAPGPGDDRADERVPMSRIRARIAQRLVDAQQSMAILTTFNEVNMKPVMDLRNKYKAEFEKKHGVRLGFMPFFVTAAAEALKRYPAVNASIEGNDIVYHHYYDIGIAVSSPRGLLVPILRDADRLGYAQIESTIRDFGTRAQENQIGIEELTGGTFTISNGGVFGSLLSTPILNPPQSGILGMHNITERPVAENGNVVIRPVMYLALSYDHRIIDGREAVLFLVAIKELLEDPARLLLQV